MPIANDVHPFGTCLAVPGPRVVITEHSLRVGDIEGKGFSHGKHTARVLGGDVELDDELLGADALRVVLLGIETWRSLRISLAGMAGYGRSFMWKHPGWPLEHVAAGQSAPERLAIGHPRVPAVWELHRTLRCVPSARSHVELTFTDEFIDASDDPIAVYATLDEWVLGFLRGNVLIARPRPEVSLALARRQWIGDKCDGEVLLTWEGAAVAETAIRYSQR